MLISQIIQLLETKAPLAFQESYDNAGLLTGCADWECSGAICTLDATENVLQEAKANGYNLVIAHHPILFKGIKQLTGKNYIEKALIYAIKNDIAIYAIHTNLDNIADGVNKMIAERIGLINTHILLPKPSTLVKLVCFVPLPNATKLREALFEAGAGQIGEYSEVSFSTNGLGGFKGSPFSNPVIGSRGIREIVAEERVEVILPTHLQYQVVNALKSVHPYEEPAFDIFPLLNENQLVGSGLMGELPEPISEKELLRLLQVQFGLAVIKHTQLLNQPVQKIAVCGGSGSSLITAASKAGAEFYITADIKYHEFFDANKRLVLADIGHWESEQYTIDLLFSIITTNFPNFAVLKTTVRTNPVHYFVGQ
jgi:dinuclear metal center YbgI/SA1388 family protein